MDVLVNGCVDGVQNPNLSSDLFHFEQDLETEELSREEIVNYVTI